MNKVKLVGINLRNADLRGADFRESVLTRARLDWANLEGARMQTCRMEKASLFGAYCRETRLDDAILNEADLSNASFRKSTLRGANLSGSLLSGTKFSRTDLCFSQLFGAALYEAIFADIDLSRTRGLEGCRYLGPSVLDSRTLVKSDKLPLSFLRGCGLPDNYIEYLPSLMNRPIQFYSCFISYSTKDQEFADRLHSDLQNKGVRCWFAPHDITAGRKIYEQIDEAIRVYERLLLILSEHSMKSNWVETEILKARKRELGEERRMLFPVRLVDFQKLQNWECFDADTGKDSAREIREYFIPDFSNWKDHDSYKQSFDRLLRDLQSKAQSAPHQTE